VGESWVKEREDMGRADQGGNSRVGHKGECIRNKQRGIERAGRDLHTAPVYRDKMDFFSYGNTPACAKRGPGTRGNWGPLRVSRRHTRGLRLRGIGEQNAIGEGGTHAAKGPAGHGRAGLDETHSP